MRLVKFAALVLFFLIFQSCKIIYHYNIGQSREEFFKSNTKRANKNLIIIKQSSDQVIYRGGLDLFFYFQNGNLIEVNRGENAPKLIIENRPQ